jgi:hypothetical protein
VNSIIGDVYENLSRKSKFSYNLTKVLALYMKTKQILFFLAILIGQKSAFFEKNYQADRMAEEVQILGECTNVTLYVHCTSCLYRITVLFFSFVSKKSLTLSPKRLYRSLAYSSNKSAVLIFAHPPMS